MSRVGHVQSRTPVIDKENATSRLMLAKQTGLNSSSKSHSIMKKKTLADVGNTVRDKGASSSSKPTLKLDQKQPIKKTKNVLRDLKTNENHLKKDSDQSIKQSLKVDQKTNIDDHDGKYIPPVCACDDFEDDFSDFMFKDLKPSKKTVEDLALIWENPIFTAADTREIKVDLSPLESLVWPEPAFQTDFLINEEDLEVPNVPYVF